MHLYNITDEGNWEGKNIPEVDPDTSYQSLMEQRIQTQAARQKILSHRTKTRVLPGIDRKILADWNALLVSAWCRAYRATGEKRYLKLALSTISYLKNPFGLVVFFQIDVFFDPSGTFSPGQAIVEFEDDDILD